MKIISIRPVAGAKCIAIFDLQVGDHIRICNLMLRRLPDGQLRTVAPNAGGKHAVTFHPVLAEQISKAAEAALGGPVAHDHHQR